MYGVPVPTYAVVRREYPNQELSYFVEEDDFIEIHGKRFCKPFVEKPIDGNSSQFSKFYNVLLLLYFLLTLLCVGSNNVSCHFCLAQYIYAQRDGKSGTLAEKTKLDFMAGCYI